MTSFKFAALFAATLAVTVPAHAQFQLPTSIDGAKALFNKGKNVVDALREFTLEDELALGEGMASNLLGAAPLYNNAAAQRYVNQVGQWVAAQGERSDLTWRFAVLDDAEANAFAAPGGYIFITRGLLYGLRNEAELAGVLAHEIAHVLRKHQLAAIKKAARTALGKEFLSEKAEQKMARSGNGQLTPLFRELSNIGTTLYARGLDKDDEYEADRMAVVLAARAGYNPYGLPSVLQTLQTVNADHEGLALMFKTHPPFNARLDALSAVMAQGFDAFERQPDGAERFKTSLSDPVSPAKPKKI
ncbi:M48 family metalloprotease [Pseudoduganella ginsengisoli]|uniref:M48 family metalloprotease n=1 Tax=Pseudoduganella ginsengisoli TaxID=1462440 RepID=A0A6L6Q4G8_9BURK|nr:M48 family metalloprotease [Pseudoduganella ginsengisoli]MTW04396.1 M48 family metalloprotease [Pseudoduganella ginsengisoli]